jgi:iron(III) transport system substrate-binding protein
MRTLMLRFATALTFVLGFAAAAAGQEALTVYFSQHAALTREWAEAFTQKTGIEVVIRRGTDMVVANQIIQEGMTSPADIFLTENSPAMALVDQAGLFAPVPPETLAQVPEEFRPSSGNWMGIAARTTVFAYNTTMLTEAELPKSMMDLARPEWQGRWGAAPAGADFQAIVSALLELRGEEETAAWLAGLKANALAYRGNGEALRGVNLGEIAGAVIYHYYYFGDKAGTGENTNNVALHYFRNEDPGAFVSISGGGILKASDNLEAAQAFLAFITGPDGQALVRDGNSHEYPIGVGVDIGSELPPLDSLGYPKVDPSLLNAQAVVGLMTGAGVL